MALSEFQKEWEICAEALEYLKSQWKTHNNQKVLLCLCCYNGAIKGYFFVKTIKFETSVLFK